MMQNLSFNVKTVIEYIELITKELKDFRTAQYFESVLQRR